MKILSIAIVGIIIVAMTSIGVFIEKLGGDQQPYVTIEINGMKENYTSGEPVAFSVVVGGYGSGCGATKAIIFKENDSQYQSPTWSITPQCAAGTISHYFKFNSMSENTRINQTGNYILQVSFGDMMTLRNSTMIEKFSILGGKFEANLNLLDTYNKTLAPDANLISQQILYNQTAIQVAKPIANPECVDKIMAQEHAQDVPIDNIRALDLATNYTTYKLKTMGHNYTLNRIYHDFSIDSCTAQIRDVIVQFVEKNSAGHSLITITEDLGLDRVKTLDISQVNDEPVTHVDAYMTPMAPQIDNDLILFIILAIGSISVVLFFIFRVRKKK